MTLRWDLHAWDDFLYWLDTDKAIACRLRALLQRVRAHAHYWHG